MKVAGPPFRMPRRRKPHVHPAASPAEGYTAQRTPDSPRTGQCRSKAMPYRQLRGVVILQYQPFRNDAASSSATNVRRTSAISCSKVFKADMSRVNEGNSVTDRRPVDRRMSFSSCRFVGVLRCGITSVHRRPDQGSRPHSLVLAIQSPSCGVPDRPCTI